MRQARRIGRLAGIAVASAWIAAGSVSAAPNTGRISFSGGADITTAYFFRGILQERDGFIIQPYAELGVSLYKGEGPLSGLSLFGGFWNSIHQEATGASATELDVLYEQDWYGGLQLQLFDDKVTSRAFYIAYTSPNDAFATVQEVDLSASLDDSEWLGAFALNPSILFGFETENTAFGTERGQYMELGLNPGLDLIESDTYPVRLSFPQKVGTSLDDYYEVTDDNEDFFGYYSGGIKLSVPLAFIPEDYGAWSASGGVQFMVLGRNTGDLNDEDFWTVGTWGISMSY